MPSPRHRSPRIQLTLAPEVMAVLSQISEATGTGKATLVAELMQEALPMLQATLEAIKHVKDAPREAQAILTRSATEATAKLAQAQLELDDLLMQKPKVKRKKRGPRSGAT